MLLLAEAMTNQIIAGLNWTHDQALAIAKSIVLSMQGIFLALAETEINLPDSRL